MSDKLFPNLELLDAFIVICSSTHNTTITTIYACMVNHFLLRLYIVQLQSNPVQVHIIFLLVIGNTCVFHILAVPLQYKL